MEVNRGMPISGREGYVEKERRSWIGGTVGSS